MAKASSFVERERRGSIAAVEDMAATCVAVYRSALKYDGLPEDTKFAVFSEWNPFVQFIDKAFGQYCEMAANVAAFGYEGLSISSREVYKRVRRKTPKANGKAIQARD